MKKGTVRKKNVFHEFIAAKMGEWGKKHFKKFKRNKRNTYYHLQKAKFEVEELSGSFLYFASNIKRI